MKKLIFLAIFLFISGLAYADTATTQQPVPLVQFSECNRSYAKPAEPVFYIVLSAIAKNGYKVNEIQSKNGLILFSAGNKEFFVNITQIDGQTALVKITPADNNYSFQYSLLDNIFQTVASDLNKNIYKLN